MPATRRPRTALPCLLLVALALALQTTAAHAQEHGEDDGDALSARIGLEASPQLRAEKRIRSHGHWAWTLLGTTSTGYDSNLYNSPDSEQGSAFTRTGFEVQLRHHLTESDRLKISTRMTHKKFFADADADEFGQRFDVAHTHRFGPDLRLSTLASVAHENDHALDIDGDVLTRDFEHMAYRVKPTLFLDLGETQQLRFSYAAKRKDYFETDDLDSLDWWKHGPSARHRKRFATGETSGHLDTFYEFSMQSYDEELAATPDGTLDGSEQASNDVEEHFFHKLGTTVSWRVLPWLGIRGGYRVKLKEDSFADFESYVSHRGELSFELNPMQSLALRLRTRYTHRDFSERPADSAGQSLAYDKVLMHLSGRYQLTKNLASFAAYDFGFRDSNRDTGTTYRDFEGHRILSGVALAY